MSLFEAVLLDRDGTLIENVPYLRDPAQLVPMPGARAALDQLRAAGLRLGVVTNQSGLARGRFSSDDLARVHARLEGLLGRVDTWQVCPHDPDAGCGCRKPAPGLVRAAAAALDTRPAQCVVIGDVGTDLAAAAAAGATGILVPTSETRPTEVAAAPAVAPDLTQAVDDILHRIALAHGGAAPPSPRGRHVLAVRPDSAGDVLLTGPALRAVANRTGRLTLWCGPRGRAAAELLPGVDELIQWRVPWLDPQPPPVRSPDIRWMVAAVADRSPDEAIVFTSFHQSPLPTALLLRMAGVPRVSAISDDYPGSLLDLRHRVRPGLPEPERALSLAAAAGYPLPGGDDARLRARLVHDSGRDPATVVVHPGASAPARAGSPHWCAELVRSLHRAGHRVLVTGTTAERELTRFVAGEQAIDLGGQTSLRDLAQVLAGAGCVVAGNTGPAHLAAAVGTPVVSLFAPTVPFGQWGPFRVPHARFGDPAAGCRNTRAWTCPVPGHPCLDTISIPEVVAAVTQLSAASPPVTP